MNRKQGEKRPGGKAWGSRSMGMLIAMLMMTVMPMAMAGGEPLLWQTLTPRKGATISVYCVQPENPQFGEEVVFYCEFSGCAKEEFTYDWQYSEDRVYWTSFGSGRPRRCFPLSETTAGKYVRLVVEEK